MTLAFDVEERRWLVLAGGGDVRSESVVFKQCVCVIICGKQGRGEGLSVKRTCRWMDGSRGREG
jgi:hypothetical protein